MRTIVLTAFVTDALREHMRHYSPIGPDGLAFSTRAGKCAYNGIQIAISRTLRAMGYEGVLIDDLRHFGQLLAATAYAHASRDNGCSIAEHMNAQRATVVDLQSRRQPGRGG